jgi:hypothetical protein
MDGPALEEKREAKHNSLKIMPPYQNQPPPVQNAALFCQVSHSMTFYQLVDLRSGKWEWYFLWRSWWTG